MKKLTYIDACVLIAACKGEDAVHERAMAVLDDPDREFASSAFVRLEVVPKPHFHKKTDEMGFYNAFFASVTHWAQPMDAIVAKAQAEAEKCGLQAMDALHVAAAALLKGRVGDRRKTDQTDTSNDCGESRWYSR